MATHPDVGSPSALDVVVTGTHSDAHTWNLVYIQLLLEEFGHRVTNLGPCVPADLLVASCRELCPGLVVVGTLNGHGYYDGMRLIRRIREEPALADTRVVIGGNLGTAGAVDGELARHLVSAGFDAAFDGRAGAEPLRSYLAALPGRVPR